VSEFIQSALTCAIEAAIASFTLIGVVSFLAVSWLEMLPIEPFRATCYPAGGSFAGTDAKRR
jgi:hypothetical protein